MPQPIPEFITITDTGIRHTDSIELVPGDDPILREVLPTFVFGFNSRAIGTANLLIDAMNKHAGLGISANQIGLRDRCFVMGVADNVVAYFNPEIVHFSEETELQSEGCLSYPGFFVNVRRSKEIVIKYQDYEGNFHQKGFSGMTAKIAQHEVDHLNGITIKQRAGKMALKIASKKFKKGKK